MQGHLVQNGRVRTQALVRIGVLSAIAFLLMLLEVHIPPFPTYLQYNPGDVPALLGGYAMGPVAGFLIVTLRNILFMLSGKDEAGIIGTAANYVASFPLVVVAAWVYGRMRSLRGAMAGIALGLVASVLAASLGNYFVFLPAWGIADAGVRAGLITGVVVPFNTVRVLITAVFTFLLYKRVRVYLG
jgi:riboflavin transporter FmnP